MLGDADVCGLHRIRKLVNAPGFGLRPHGRIIGGTGQIFPCSLGAPVDVSKSSVLDITHAEGQGEVRDTFYSRAKIQNKAGEGVYSAVAGKSSDLTTGKYDTDKVGVKLKTYETVDYPLVTGGGCPASGTAATCQCEAWIDIMT